jgi:arylsulfate sulfotransferase
MKTARTALLTAGLSLICFVAGCSTGGSPNVLKTGGPPTPITVSLSPTSAGVGTGNSTTLRVAITGDTQVTWTVNGVPNGNSDVGTLTVSGLEGQYTAPAGPTGLVATVTATSVADTTVSASATIYVVAPGAVATTANTQVASYSITVPAEADVSVQFGPTTSYGLVTSQTQSAANGGTVTTLVAGMQASSLYHMQAIVNFPDGAQYIDPDQTFTTGATPTNIGRFTATATTTPGMTPQPGVEMLDLVGAGPDVTDLNGNVIWYYDWVGAAGGTIIQPIRPISNGHFLIVGSPNSSNPLAAPIPPTATNEIREVDLAGNIIRSLNISQLNTALANAGFSLNALDIHHDILELPNGHWVFFVNSLKSFTGLAGEPSPINVLGDAVVDVDTNLNPVWVWNSFDHLDINRHPYMFPDWTHANALLYTSDGNLLVSLRHQNWIIKVDYQNGSGTGDVLWHLGYQGDFTLMNGTNPTDWTYAQHGPNFFGSGSAGVFNLGVMDNGDDRVYPNGVSCTGTCPYTSVPIYQIDENAKTATIVFHDILSQYSFFGGDVESLANGNVEFDLCSDTSLGAGVQAGTVSEVTQTASPQLVWKMTIAGNYAYRMFRMPSLYPGVQW